MANAGRCYLNIPFKSYLGSFADSLNDDGTIDPERLRLAADREFENYKAIERRVNDTSCSGGDAKAYCAVYQGTLAGGESTSATLELSLATTSTVNIQIDWAMPGSAGTYRWSLDGSTVAVPSPMSYNLNPWSDSIHTAATLSAGSHTIVSYIDGYFGDGSSFGPARTCIAVVVGSDTGDDCVTFE